MESENSSVIFFQISTDVTGAPPPTTPLIVPPPFSRLPLLCLALRWKSTSGARKKGEKAGGHEKVLVLRACDFSQWFFSVSPLPSLAPK